MIPVKVGKERDILRRGGNRRACVCGFGITLQCFQNLFLLLKCSVLLLLQVLIARKGDLGVKEKEENYRAGGGEFRNGVSRLSYIFF